MSHVLRMEIQFSGQQRTLACDGRCDKAWGKNTRPCIQLDPENPDDFAWKSDGELGVAPVDPGTYEGDQPKPSPGAKLESKWCARECERSVTVDGGEPVVLRDFSQRYYNIRPHKRVSPLEIPDEELVRRAVCSATSTTERRALWACVADRFCVGSTIAAALCRRFRVDPDEEVGG